MKMQWGRLMTAMITPFDNEGNVDFNKAAILADSLFKNGSDGLVLWGTTAESPVLSLEEKKHLYLTVKEKVGTAGPLILGTGTNDTKKTIAMTEMANKLGADGIMVVAPYYNKPSQKGLYEHFRAVAESTDLPIMLYNVPGRTGVSMTVDTIAQLSEIKNIAAVKEASGEVMRVTELRNAVRSEDFLIYSGDDALTLPMLALGAHGTISVASHIAGKPMRKMIELYVEGHIDQALKLHEELIPLFDAIFYDVNPVGVKVMLDKLGFATGGLRLPLVDSDEITKARILGTLAKYEGNNEILNNFMEVLSK